MTIGWPTCYHNSRFTVDETGRCWFLSHKMSRFKMTYMHVEALEYISRPGCVWSQPNCMYSFHKTPMLKYARKGSSNCVRNLRGACVHRGNKDQQQQAIANYSRIMTSQIATTGERCPTCVGIQWYKCGLSRSSQVWALSNIFQLFGNSPIGSTQQAAPRVGATSSA